MLSRILVAAFLTILSLPAYCQSPPANTRTTVPGSQGTPPVQNGQSGRPEKFEVLSIRPVPSIQVRRNSIENPTPNGYRATANLGEMVKFVYSPPGPAWTYLFAEMRNEPSWFADYYDIEAHVSQADLKAWQEQSRDHELLRSALRAALKERCKLAIHEEPSQKPIFELVIAKRGPKLKPAASGSALPIGVKLESGGVKTGIGSRAADGWNYYGATMLDLALDLTILSPGTPVRDRTGLTGRYDFSVHRVQLEPGEQQVYGYAIGPLGLDLRTGRENRPMLVIDRVERPTPN